MADLILTHPCPLCPPPGRMLTVTYEPLTRDAQDTGASLISVTGCPHAEAAMAEWSGAPCTVPVAFWRELQHELQMYMLDRYTDQLESSAKYRRWRTSAHYPYWKG